jgi:hypothetical protein
MAATYKSDNVNTKDNTKINLISFQMILQCWTIKLDGNLINLTGLRKNSWI